MIYSTLKSMLAAGAFLALSVSSGQALTYNWSFVATDFDNIGETVSGTISGLVEGANDGNAVTLEVLSTPTGQLTGGGWTFYYSYGGTAFTVTGGVLTSADAIYVRGSDGESVILGDGGVYTSRVGNYITLDPYWYTGAAPTFTLVPEMSPVPLPAGLPLLGTALAVLALRRRARRVRVV